MSVNFRTGHLTGPRFEGSQLYMRRALLRDADSRAPGVVLAQFDDMAVEYLGVKFGFGWHYFPASDFTLEEEEGE